jgi:hypothetical protein
LYVYFVTIDKRLLLFVLKLLLRKVGFLQYAVVAGRRRAAAAAAAARAGERRRRRHHAAAAATALGMMSKALYSSLSALCTLLLPSAVISLDNGVGLTPP